MSLRRKVFETAAELVEAGWCQNSMAKGTRGEDTEIYNNNVCQVCAMGALIRAGLMYDEYALDYVRAVEEKMAWAPGYTLIRWNDEEERTAEEVAAMLRAMGEKFN